jgi:hypothetical protein
MMTFILLVLTKCAAPGCGNTSGEGAITQLVNVSDKTFHGHSLYGGYFLLASDDASIGAQSEYAKNGEVHRIH